MKILSVIGMTVLLAVTALSGVGCSSKPRLVECDIVVSPGGNLVQELAGKPLQVDLIGVNDTDIAKYAGVSVDDYFAGTSAVRSDAGDLRTTFNFNGNATGAQVLSVSGKTYALWRERGVKKIAILASGRGLKPAAGADMRKLMFPLTNKEWERGQKIQIIVKESGIECATAQKPQKE